MKKILFLMPNKGYSGAENVVIQIINGISDEYECFYVSESGSINEYLKENNINHIVTNKKLNLKELNKVINQIEPDVIVATDFNASVRISFLKKRLNIISHLHNNPKWIKSINLKSLSYLFASYRFKKIFIVSESIKKEYIFSRFIKKKYINISNPISCEKVLKESEKYGNEKIYDLAFVGRLCEQKDPITFIKIVYELKKYMPNIKVLIAGTGSWKRKVLNAINEYNINDVVEYVGFQKEPYKYIKQSKIICMPSVVEGFGLVAFEAITMGIPVIARPVGGLIDIVDDTSGFLVKEKEEFVNCILELLKDKELYEKLSLGAIQRSKKIENYNQYIKNIKQQFKEISGE